MIHERHYTLEEANRLLAKVESLLGELREARDQLTDSELHDALGESAPSNGGGEPGRKVGEAFLRVRGMLGVLEQLGLVIRDLDRGLIDFPAILDGREAYLCWQAGEEEIRFWHGVEDGFAGRRPIE